jgi:hypothetical protein
MSEKSVKLNWKSLVLDFLEKLIPFKKIKHTTIIAIVKNKYPT